MMAATEDEIKIVVERLKVMPRSVNLNIGGFGSFSRDELIDAVSGKTEIGELVVEMQMAYLRSFKERAKQ